MHTDTHTDMHPYLFPFVPKHAPHALPPPNMVWVPQEVMVDMNALRQQVEAEVSQKYKQRIDLLNRSIDTLERENLRLNRLVQKIRRERKSKHDSVEEARLDALMANKALELQKLGIM